MSDSCKIDCAFPGGNILVEKIDGNIVTLRQDRRDTEGYWFYWYFRIRGAAGRTLIFNFTDGKPVGVRGAAISRDEGISWSWLGSETATEKSFTYRFEQNENSVRFSFAMPYTEANWNLFLNRLSSKSAIESGALCASRKGRTVEMLRAGRLDGNAPLRVSLTARHHCCEMMANYVMEGILESVLNDEHPGFRLREHAEFFVVPFVDKDGVEDGDQGKNRRPLDHGRDYGAQSIYPESRAIQDRISGWIQEPCDTTIMVIDLHCPAIRGYWNEHIYQVGKPEQRNWKEQQRLAKCLEPSITGSLPYSADDDLPFGAAWNTTLNYKGGEGFSRWASNLSGVKLATSFETPYANASGKEVNADSARAFGHDLGNALCKYLSSEIKTMP